jgi:hypothetical protein
VWLAKSNGASPTASKKTALYIVLGAQQLQAAVFAQGQWQSDITVDVTPSLNSVEAYPQHAPWQGALLSLSSSLSSQQAVGVWSGADGTDVYVAVSEQWLRSETVPWGRALYAGDTNAAVVAYMQGAGLGVQVQDTVRYEEAPWGCARWAVAYPAVLMQALAQCTQVLKGRLISVMPTASLVSQQLVRQQVGARLVAYTESHSFHLVEVERGRVLSVLQRPMPAALSNNAQTVWVGVLSLWHSIQLRSPHWASVTELPLLTDASDSTVGSVQGLKRIDWPAIEQNSTPPLLRALRAFAAPAHPLNAVAVQRRMGLWQAMLLAVAIVALALMGWKIAMDAQAVRQMATMQPTGSTTAAPSLPRSLNKSQQEQVLAANIAIRQLNLPAAQLLRALAPPKDIRVALLGIDLSDSANESAAAKFKLNAETRSGEEMTRYIAFLADRKPFVQAYLVRHEVMQNMPERPWRFTLELTWQP